MGLVLQNVSLEEQLKFAAVNVCKIPSDLEIGLPSELTRKGFVRGLSAFASLLARMYEEHEIFEGRDTKTKKNNLYESQKFLYACFLFGQLQPAKSNIVLVADRSVLCRELKKKCFAREIRILSRVGVTTSGFSADGKVVLVGKSSSILLQSREKELIPSVMHFVKQMEQVDTGPKHHHFYGFSFESYADKLVLFAKADVKTVSAGRTALLRKSLDPLREDILLSLPSFAIDWRQLCDKLLGSLGFRSTGQCGFVQWCVHFTRTQKKSFLIFSIGYDRIFAELRVSRPTLRDAIKMSKAFSDNISSALNSYTKCRNCHIRCNGKNMVEEDGLTLCKGRSPKMYFSVSCSEDFRSIAKIADMAYGTEGKRTS